MASIVPFIFLGLDKGFPVLERLFVNEWLRVLALLILQAVMVLWVLDFDVKVIELIHFLSPPSIFTLVGFLAIKDLDFRLSLPVLIVFMIGFYILLTALNVINVSTVRPVPLKKAAISTLFFLGLVMFSVLMVILLNAGWGINNKLWWFWIMMALFGTNFLYLAAENNKLHQVETLVFALITLKILILINFWPATHLVSAIALNGWIFVMLGLLLHHINKSLNESISREYLIISLLLLGVFLWTG